MIPPPSNKRFILTGGPGSGKTTTLEVLRSRGFVCISEVARGVIQNRIAAGLPPRPNAAEFAREIFAADVAQYDKCPEGTITFFDRGIADALGMLCDAGEIELTGAITELVKRPYDQFVFFFPPWRDIFTMDAERDQTFAESVKISDRIRTWYRALGLTLVEVPPGSASARAHFIEEWVAERSKV